MNREELSLTLLKLIWFYYEVGCKNASLDDSPLRPEGILHVISLSRHIALILDALASVTT